MLRLRWYIVTMVGRQVRWRDKTYTATLTASSGVWLGTEVLADSCQSYVSFRNWLSKTSAIDTDNIENMKILGSRNVSGAEKGLEFKTGPKLEKMKQFHILEQTTKYA